MGKLKFTEPRTIGAHRLMGLPQLGANHPRTQVTDGEGQPLLQANTSGAQPERC